MDKFIGRKGRQYKSLLLAHPDCRDPDHPGCSKCYPEEFKEEKEDTLEDLNDFYDESFVSSLIN